MAPPSSSPCRPKRPRCQRRRFTANSRRLNGPVTFPLIR
jgi:hypothetical protein